MMTRHVRSVALLVTALVLAAGCSAGGSTAGASGVEKPDLTVAVVPSLDSAGFFVALYQRLFKDEGLNVTFKPAISSETVIDQQALSTPGSKDALDITAGNYVSYIQAQGNWDMGQRPSASNSGILAANLDIFAEGSVMEPGAMGLFTKAHSPIKTLDNLKGRTIGINAPNNILYLLIASVLTEHGISLNQVHFKIIPLPGMADALNSGAVSAAVLPEPFASIAEEVNGAVPLTDLNQGATTTFPVLGYVVTKQWAQRYPRTLAAFYKALEEGQQIADTDRGAVEAAMGQLPKPLAVPKETAAVLALDNYPVSSGPAGSVDPVRLQRVVNVMRQFIQFQPFRVNSMLMGG